MPLWPTHLDEGRPCVIDHVKQPKGAVMYSFLSLLTPST